MRYSNQKIKCSILPAATVTIQDRSDHNQFSIHFQTYTSLSPKAGGFLEADYLATFTTANIYVIPVLGQEVGALCSEAEAANTLFECISGQEGCTMKWQGRTAEEKSPHFLVTIPRYDAAVGLCIAFRSKGFYTSAKAGMTDLSIKTKGMQYYPEYNDMLLEDYPVSLYKQNPIMIQKFEMTPPGLIALGESYQVRWEVDFATSCFVNKKKVSPKNSMACVACAPTMHEIIAVNETGQWQVQNKWLETKAPQVIFESNITYFHTNEKVTLRWEVSSANALSITPDIGHNGFRGEKELAFTDSQLVTIAASGYFENEPVVIRKEIMLHSVKREWKKIGDWSSVPANNTINGRMWYIDGSYYFYNGSGLYRSQDLKYVEEIKHPFSDYEADTSRCTTAKITFLDKTYFVIAGISSKLSPQSWVMFLEPKTGVMQTGKNFPNRYVGGVVCAADELVLYAVLDNAALSLWKLYDPNIGEEQRYQLDDEPYVALDAIIWQGKLYLALKRKDHYVTIYSTLDVKDYRRLHWSKRCTSAQPISGFFKLIAQKGLLYLLTKDGMIRCDNGQKVPGWFPPITDSPPWVGYRDNDITLIGKGEGGGYAVWKNSLLNAQTL